MQCWRRESEKGTQFISEVLTWASGLSWRRMGQEVEGSVKPSWPRNGLAGCLYSGSERRPGEEVIIPVMSGSHHSGSLKKWSLSSRVHFVKPIWVTSLYRVWKHYLTADRFCPLWLWSPSQCGSCLYLSNLIYSQLHSALDLFCFLKTQTWPSILFPAVEIVYLLFFLLGGGYDILKKFGAHY